MIAIALMLAGVSPQAATALPVASVSSVDPARLTIARQVVAVVLPPEQRQQIMGSFLRAMMSNMVAGLVNGTPGLKDELASKPRVKVVFDHFVARQLDLGQADLNAALPDLVEAYARAYARQFTLDELTAIRSFVSTPTGAKFMQRGPALIADPDVAAWQRRVTEQGAARQQTEMAAFVRDLTQARAGGGQ